MLLCQLFERFDKILPIKYESKGNDWVVASFEIAPEDIVRVTCERDGEPPVWDISFGRGKPDTALKTAVTGEGNAQAVFATVMEVMKQFIASYKPEFISFSSFSGEDSRISLYGKMATRYAKTIGYRLVQDPMNDPEVPDWFKEELPGKSKYQEIFLLAKA